MHIYQTICNIVRKIITISIICVSEYQSLYFDVVLLYGGRVLKPSKTLTDYKIIDGVTVFYLKKQGTCEEYLIILDNLIN